MDNIKLENIFDQISKFRESENITTSNFDWEDYEFGKNFFETVVREPKQTKLETDFIIKRLNLKKGDKILDLGCGGGRNSFELAKKGFSVVGIDLNKYAIEQANLEKKQNKLNIDFSVKNILDIDYTEEFNAIILIFNHFSIFSKVEVKKLLNKISKSLVKGGKVLIEIQSLNQGLNLDGSQEWEILEEWISGKFKQLILVENTFDDKKNLHIRDDYCIRLSDGKLFKFTQISQLYTLDEIHSLFRQFQLKLIQSFGDWNGKIFEDDDNTLIIIGQKD